MTTIKVDVYSGPPGGHGFRTGYWSATRGDVTLSVFASVPHRCELDQQARLVKRTAEKAFADLDAGKPESAMWRRLP